MLDSRIPSRVKNIYLPKVEFLKSVIKKKISLLEIGSGAGHFLKACELKNISAIGYETNNDLVNIGKKKLKKKQNCLFIFRQNLSSSFERR